MAEKVDIFVAETGRRYVALRDLSNLTGISQIELDYKYRAADWATPRDFRFEGGRLWFAEMSLQRVVDALFAAGKTDEAIRLRDWMARHVADTYALTAGSGGVGDNRVEEAQIPAAPAREVRSRLLQWEDQHS